MPLPPTATRILAAARGILDEDGAEALTLRGVAEVVGLTPMAIYRHFPSRAALLNAVAEAGFEELAADLKGRRVTGGAPQRLAKMGSLFLEHALANPRLFDLMFLRPREGARRYPGDYKAGHSPTASLLAEAVVAGMAHGEFREDDPWEIVFEMGALSHGLIQLYFSGRTQLTLPQFRALHQRSFARYIHGLCS